MNALNGQSLKNSMLKAVIIGAGGIGAAYDQDRKTKGILTHAHAYRAAKGFALSGFYDTNPAKAKAAAKSWKARSFETLTEMLQGKPDIVSICVPDLYHAKTLHQVIKYQPKAIFCEKPLTVNSKTSEAILRTCKKEGILLTVNYTRRFCPEIIQLRSDIQKGLYGKSISAVCTYTKGIRHNGSHAVDLLNFFFGKVRSGQVLAVRKDGTPEDPALDAFLTAERCPAIHLVSGSAQHYSIFEMDLLFEKKRIVLSESGRKILFYSVQSHTDYPGFKILSKPSVQKTRMAEALKFAVESIAAALHKKELPQDSAESALEAQKVCDLLIRKAGRL